MEEIKVKAIVIGSTDYKENDKLVTLFTLENGIITTCFKGVKKSDAKLKSAKEMFTFGDFIYTGGKTNVVTSANIISSFYDITKNIKRYYVACNILSILKTVLPPAEPNPELFLDVVMALTLLDGSEVSEQLVICKFLIRIFEGFGYQFNLNRCNTCGQPFNLKRYINLRYGDITCGSCRMGEVMELSPAVYGALRLISQIDYSNLRSLKISNQTLSDVLSVLSKNYYYRFNSNLELL